MRMMLQFKIPVERGNQAVTAGALAKTIQALVAARRPEALYFHLDDGQRAGTMVFDLADAAELPKIAEPLFANLNAALTIQPVMTVEDLQRGLGAPAA